MTAQKSQIRNLKISARNLDKIIAFLSIYPSVQIAKFRFGVERILYFKYIYVMMMMMSADRLHGVI